MTVPVGPDDIVRAAKRISAYVRRTPVIDYDDVTLKLEQLQHTGSFKARGAFNRLLSTEVPPAGLVAASGGNHGAAVAFAARRLGHRAEIFVPRSSPSSKVERIRSYGADVIVGGEVYDDAQHACDIRQRETGALLVHPYDHVDTVAGAGTVGYELDADAPHLDTVLVAVGGGGLCAGVAAWYAGRIKVVAVEPELVPAMHVALAAGEATDVVVGPSIAADSLGAKRIGAVPFSVARAFVNDSVLVADDDIRHAQRVFWDDLRLMIEPGGAAAYAALMSGAYRREAGERVAVIVCGANFDPSFLGKAITG